MAGVDLKARARRLHHLAHGVGVVAVAVLQRKKKTEGAQRLREPAAAGVVLRATSGCVAHVLVKELCEAGLELAVLLRRLLSHLASPAPSAPSP